MKKSITIKTVLLVFIMATLLALSFIIHNRIEDKPLYAFSRNSNDNKESIPVLMYHAIRDGEDNPYIIPVAKFKEQMEYLKAEGYNTLTMDELYNYLNSNIKIPKKSIVLTFDDGYEDNYLNAYPILKKMGFKATIFVVPSYLDKGTLFLKTDDLRVMSENGIEIESHTYNHVKLSTLSYEEQKDNLKKAKEILEDKINKKVNFIAYPFGSYNDETFKAVKASGYKMAFTIEGRWAPKRTNALKVNRIYIGPKTRMNDFISRVENPDYCIR